MKAFLRAVCILGFLLGNLQAAQPSFIIITTKTEWPDGTVSPVGEVEMCDSENVKGYIVTVNGKIYGVPKANARPISAADAALALLRLRAALGAQVAALDAQIAAAKLAAVNAQAAAAKLAAAPPAAAPPAAVPPFGKQAQAARPTQYNGRPLPLNWIDPKEADARFFEQQRAQRMNAIESENAQLRQQLQRQR